MFLLYRNVFLFVFCSLNSYVFAYETLYVEKKPREMMSCEFSGDVGHFYDGRKVLKEQERVFKDFGPLYVKPTALSANARISRKRVEVGDWDHWMEFPVKDAIQYGFPYKMVLEETYQDILPAAFHQSVVKILRKKERLPIVKLHPRGPWKKVLYRYAYTISEATDRSNIMQVTAYAWYTSEDRPDEKSIENIDVAKYTYELCVDKGDVRDGLYKVLASQWTGHSFHDHPDLVYYYPRYTPNEFFLSNQTLFLQYLKISQIISLIKHFSEPEKIETTNKINPEIDKPVSNAASVEELDEEEKTHQDLSLQGSLFPYADLALFGGTIVFTFIYCLFFEPFWI